MIYKKLLKLPLWVEYGCGSFGVWVGRPGKGVVFRITKNGVFGNGKKWVICFWRECPIG